VQAEYGRRSIPNPGDYYYGRRRRKPANRHALSTLDRQNHRVALEAVQAIPTDARGRIHGVLRMLGLSWGILARRRVDIIQAQDPVPTGLLALVLGRVFRRPVNVGVFGPNPYDEHWLRAHWTHQLQAPLARWVLRHAQGIQVDGQLTARRLAAAGLGHVRVKPMVPMNLDEFLAIRRPGPPERAVARLLYVGRLTRQKNLDLIVRIATALRAGNAPAFEVRMVGDGPEAGRLRTMIERAGLAQCVTFATVARDRIAAGFAEADVLLCPHTTRATRGS
jgi:glycosyltransferase involved in cell wall biosynthesis